MVGTSLMLKLLVVANILVTLSEGTAMFDSDFDPLAILQKHELTLNDLINAHNEVAKLTEELAQSQQKLNMRLTQTEQLIYKINSYVDDL